MATLYRIQHLIPALEQGWLILTPNRRIAAKIQQAWCQLHPGEVLDQPRVYAMDDWLLELAAEVTSQQKCLGLEEQQALWEQVIAQSNHSLLMPNKDIANLIDQADKLLLQWQLDYRQLPSDPDCQLLKNIIGQFDQALQQNHWTTPYRAFTALLQSGTLGQLNMPKKTLLCGFDDMNPLFSKLIQQMPTEASQVKADTINASAQRTSLKDNESELYAAAHWAQQQLQQNTDITIGIIVPELNRRRADVERIFHEVLEPQYCLPSTPRYSTPFNISASERLSEQGIIYSALQLLELTCSTLSLNECLALLNSPFWASSLETLEENIKIEKKLRRANQLNVSGEQLENLFNDNNYLTDILQQQNKLLKKHKNKKRLPSQWVETVQQLLQLAKWPGGRKLDSIEYQQVMQFQKVLDQLMVFDELLGKITWESLVKKIKGLCRQSPYQAKTEDSPIQILGLLEGSGLHFDALWVCNMTQSSWPPTPDPHPWIPIHIQIKEKMPHCNTEREQQFCQTISNDLLNAAKSVVISYPLTADESKQSISSLFESLPEVSVNELIQSTAEAEHPYLQVIQDTAKKECIKDSHGPVLEESRGRGGSSLLKQQSENPFDAFARYRLWADTNDEPQSGLPASNRGTLLHNCLYYFWDQLKDKVGDHGKMLREMNPQALDQAIAAAVDYALNQEKHPALDNPGYREVEQQRLHQYCSAWLQLDMERKPFRVLALEKDVTHTLEGVTLSLTIDRIDQLLDEKGEALGLLLIDYKTGSTLSGKDWETERPKEPQLPLYTLCSDVAEGNIQGIAFAHIKLDNMRYILSGTESLFKNKKNTAEARQWSEQLNQWRVVVQNLMNEYKQGYAGVSYRDEKKIPDHQKIYQRLNRWPEKSYIDSLLEEKPL